MVIVIVEDVVAHSFAFHFMSCKNTIKIYQTSLTLCFEVLTTHRNHLPGYSGATCVQELDVRSNIDVRWS